MDDVGNKLQYFWSNYVASELDSDEKKQWFDFFLGQFLLDYQSSKNISGKLAPKSKCRLYQYEAWEVILEDELRVLNVPDIIAREFILEIRNACSQTDEADELAPLKKYLLSGRGWRYLAVLQLIGTLKLTNTYELNNLLISLFVLVEYEDCLNCTKTNAYLPDFEQTSIDDIVKEKLNNIKSKTRSLQSNGPRRRSFKYNKSKDGPKSTPSTPDADLSSKLILVNAVKLQPSTLLFAKSITEDFGSSVDLLSHPKAHDQPPLERLQNEPAARVIEARVNNAEFRFLTLGVLHRLCADKLAAEDCEDVVETVIRFALENLCTIQYRFSKQHDTAIEHIRGQLTSLLVVCANRAKCCRRITDSLSQNGTIQIFLQLLQEVTSSVNKSASGPNVHENLNFLYSLSYCILILFFQILRQDNVTKNLIVFNKLYRQFIGCASGRLCECIIRTFLSASVDRSVAVRRSKILVTFLGLLIVRFKTLRRRVSRIDESCVNYDDEETPSSTDLSLSSHHDNVLGKPYKSILLAPAALHENCCVTSTFVVLLKVVLGDVDDELTITALRILVYCGTCCCVPTRWFLPKLLKALLLRQTHVKHLILLFLERRFYQDVGMYRLSSCGACVINDKSVGDVDQFKCLEEYCTLLVNEDTEMVRIVGNHLLKVFGNFSRDVQQYLICHVLASVFRRATEAYTSRGLFKDSILVCLAVFSDLSIYRTLTAQVDELLPTKAIQQLLHDSNFNELCCKILETRVICKTLPLENGGGHTFTPVLLDSCTVELNVLLSSFDECYDQVMRSIDFEDELIAKVEVGFSKTVDRGTLHRLKTIVYTLERLTVRSCVIKSYFHTHPVKNKFQKLLFLVLRVLTHDGIADKGDGHDDLRLKLMQPLLIICLCLFDNTNIIENCVKELLHEALMAGKISIKQVCDSLLSLEQVESVHKENYENINSAATTAAPLFQVDGYPTDCDDTDDEVISWSCVETAFSESSEEDGNQLVLLLDNCSKSTLLYPTVCTIAVDLINSLRVDQCTEESLYCLQHISTICLRNAEICIELTRQNVATKLLDKLEESLAEELLTPEETDVQYAITQFLSVLFYHHVNRVDLARFLDFMKKPGAPLDHLVSTLVSVVEKSDTEALPSYYLTFPVTPLDQAIEFDDPAEALAMSMRELQKHSATASPWGVCALTLPLNTNLEWCIWLTGFSTSFWLKYDALSADRGTDSKYQGGDDDRHGVNDGLIHVISVGYDTLLLESWIDESTSCLMVRLARPEGSTFEILSEATFQWALDDDLWHHIVLNVRDTMKQQKIALEISLTVDGLHEETRYLVFLGIFMRKVRPACIMLGDTRATLKTRYSLGNLMMFRATVLTRECCLTIRAFGPDFENILVCSANATRPNFAHLMRLGAAALPRDFSAVTLLRHYDENMKQMQDNVLITYTPRQPDHFHHYTQTELGNAMALSMFTPTTPALFRRTKGVRSNQRVPHATKTVVFARLQTEHRKRFYDCVQEFGGFAFLAFLFAKLVDACPAETTQCDALKLILKSAFADAQLHSQFVTVNGCNLISKVITSARFKTGRRAFGELTNVMCNKENYFTDERRDPDIFLCNPEIITGVLLPHWRCWETCDPQLMVTLFRGLHALVAQANAYRQLNSEQLSAVNVVERTLDMCKERFVFEEKPGEANRELCTAVLEFIKTMIGSPPATNHIKSIVDYLYVVHPTSHSFCTQTPSSFYFLFSSLSQNKPKPRAAEPDEDKVDGEVAAPVSGRRPTRVPYNRNLSKSLADLQEKRKTVDSFLRTSSLHLPTFADEDGKEEKTVDSGIASSSVADEPATELFGYGSMSCLAYSDDYDPEDVKDHPGNGGAIGDFRKYTSLNLATSLDNYRFAKTENGDQEDCDQYIVTTGLLNIVHDTILVLPDSSIGGIFKKVIDYKLFLILANHPNASVRYAVVRVVLAWLVRCNEEDTVRFVSHMKGFYHLANQLTAYPATEDLVNGCISLMARCHWDALEQINEMEEMTLPSLHFSALPPLLAVFPGCVHNFRLALNVIHFFKVLINKVPQALKKLIEHGLIESLVKTMLLLIHAEDNGENVTGNSILLNEIIDLFALIMNACVQTPGVLYLQILNEIVYKCRYLEVTEEALCGTEEECVQIIHNLHCNVLQSGLDTVLSLIELYHSQDIVKGRRSPSFLTSMTGSMSASLSSIPSSLMSFASSSGKQKHIPRGEMIDRYKLIINRATEYLQFSSSSVVTDKDKKFACHLFSTLINGVANIVQNKPYIRIGSPWSSVYWSARENLRTQASNLLIWMLAPKRPVSLRMYAIEALLNEPKTKEIISTLIFINVETEQRFAIFLWHLMYSKSCELSETDLEICEDFKNALQEWELISPQAIGQAHDRWQFEVASALRELSVVYWDLEKSQQHAVYKCVYKSENLSKKLSEIAASISMTVAERQGKERKKLLNIMRDKYRLHVEARNRWRNIVQQMTHEQAPWFSSYMYPDCWELDPTEGPARVRKRLRRCTLLIDKKFFKADYFEKTRTEETHPLAYLFENDDAQTLYTAALDSLSMDDTISHMCFATNVQPGYEVDGELLIGAKYLYFIATHMFEKNVTVAEADKFSLIVKFKDIKEIHNRRFQLKERAIELFLLNGKTALIAFTSQMDRDNFISALSECSLPNRVVTDTLLSNAVDKWRENHTSNWEYLKTLNKMAGRSYNDLMQYPIMPFILADYTSDVIDIREPVVYRNLKKPMAIQDKKKETYFTNHYNFLKNENTNSQNVPALKQQPYHYASHYSNSGTVLHFLLRLPPFTQIFLQYQDNNFDLPDRTFHSLDTTWRLTSSESTTDVKELIPEFFYLPEFLLNLQNFYFGVRQNGEQVENVKLPTWANGDARLFVLVHRQMLESEYVRENLPHWIDLVFGYKQTGKAAVDAINVFHPATYCGFDVDTIPDPLERAAWETMVKTYGQTPRQLFRTPHPMVVQNLIQEDDENIPVVKGVKGLKWGNYVGSPAKQPPIVVWKNFHSSPVSSLVPLVTNDVFGLPVHTSLLLSYNKERSVNLVNEGITLLGAALLSWGYMDGIVRIKERREQPQLPIIFCPPKDPISVCSTTPDCSLIWIGLSSGNILVFTYSFNPENGGVEVESEPNTLVGHKKTVNCICLSQSFGIAVSASDDDYAIVWDLNEMIYVRSIPSIGLPVSLVSISETLGDIATVCNDTILRLHTINTTLIGTVNTRERITAICFSTAPEGVSVNVLATGFENGVIKLWSTWDLSPVTDIINTSISYPIIGLTYSFDSQHLYASVSDGNVYIWEATSSSGVTKTPKFLNLTAVN